MSGKTYIGHFCRAMFLFRKGRWHLASSTRCLRGMVSDWRRKKSGAWWEWAKIETIRINILTKIILMVWLTISNCQRIWASKGMHSIWCIAHSTWKKAMVLPTIWTIDYWPSSSALSWALWAEVIWKRRKVRADLITFGSILWKWWASLEWWSLHQVERFWDQLLRLNPQSDCSRNR